MADKLTEEERTKVLETDAIIKLNTVLQIIKCLDISSSRGAFKGNEMSFVGAVYDTLVSGLNKSFDEEYKNKSLKNN